MIIYDGLKTDFMKSVENETLDTVIERIKEIQKNARENNNAERPVWPMIILRTPKGWTGPKVVDGNRIEGNFLAHQVPIMMDKPEHLEILSDWLHSYHPEKLFDENGRLIPELAALAPEGNHRIGANPHANGGKLLRDLRLPDFRDYAFEIGHHGEKESQDTSNLGAFIRDIFKLNAEAKNFRIFSPDENNSNRFSAVFDEVDRDWNARMTDEDDHLIVAAKGWKKVFVTSDPDLIKFGVTKKVTDLLDEAKIEYSVYSKIKPNPTIQNVQEGVAAFKEAKADSIIAIGGGSSMDTAKAIGIIIYNPEFADVRSLEGVAPTKHHAVPTIAVPTTAGTAAEVTINYVITDPEKERKFVCVGPDDIPETAVIDPDMMSTMPKGLTAATGMDALTHAIEGYTTKAAWEMTDMFHPRCVLYCSRRTRVRRLV